jgi:hypothetical protein
MHVRTSIKRWGIRRSHLRIGEGDAFFVAVTSSGATRDGGLIMPARRDPQIRVRRRTTPSSGRE